MIKFDNFFLFSFTLGRNYDRRNLHSHWILCRPCTVSTNNTKLIFITRIPEKYPSRKNSSGILCPSLEIYLLLIIWAMNFEIKNINTLSCGSCCPHADSNIKSGGLIYFSEQSLLLYYKLRAARLRRSWAHISLGLYHVVAPSRANSEFVWYLLGMLQARGFGYKVIFTLYFTLILFKCVLQLVI